MTTSSTATHPAAGPCRAGIAVGRCCQVRRTGKEKPSPRPRPRPRLWAGPTTCATPLCRHGSMRVFLLRRSPSGQATAWTCSYGSTSNASPGSRAKQSGAPKMPPGRQKPMAWAASAIGNTAGTNRATSARADLAAYSAQSRPVVGSPGRWLALSVSAPVTVRCSGHDLFIARQGIASDEYVRL
jgi:hypothetical protein